ncbi:MAG: glycosyl transferase [Silicimonas sp.]|nr:glycosyl transferase [Silicimonas sp.]
MAQIAYILLCHKNVASIVAQARQLTAMGDVMAIHFDARSPKSDYDRLQAELADNANVVFPKNRLKCGWGEWSLVGATINTLQAAVDAFPRATHFYMLSGDCMPIKTAEYTREFLDGRDADFIESYDFFESDWIKTGFKEERLVYRHWFNERSQAKLFYAAFNLQRKLGLTRKVPGDIQMMIGSQWWCLRRQTAEAILEFISERRDVVRFFKTTWIPDETFFQTLVRHLVPESEIDCRTLTFLMFSDYGMPVTFYNDHYDLLLAQDFSFARKISTDAHDLKSKLGELYAKEGVRFQPSDEGRRLFSFLTGQGRIGERFAPRFWEKDSTIGRERSLLIVTCKKWHVAKRLLDRIGSVSNLPTIEYLFDEEATPLPDLGGIQATLGKRTRHRRALMRMLFDYFETDTLLICLDPANLELFRDFYSDRSETRLLEIDCLYSDEYLEGHAKRVGLAGEHTSPETFQTLVPTIRNDVFRESELIRDQNFPEFYRFREKATAEENTTPLAEFLGLDRAKALEIAATEYIFVD